MSGQPSQNENMEYLSASDGHRIPFRHWPHPQPRAVVHLVHGMAEHSGCYEDVALKLNEHGYAVVAHDHRCHGLSVPQSELGNASWSQNWAGMQADMLEVNHTARGLYPQLPLILLGHSMGSFISLRFAESHSDKVDVLVLEGSNYEHPAFCQAARRIAMMEGWRQGKNARSPIVNALTFGGFNKTIKNPRTDFDWLSRNEVFVNRYIADPLCGYQCSNGFWNDFLAGLSETYKGSNLRRIRKSLPVYLLVGDKDPVSKNAKGVKALAKHLRSAGVNNLVLKTYPAARHDLLHETNADKVYRDLLNWLNAQQI